jgi:thiol-disulfide isomerase/thioredoxin/outer membrane lipoprotein-sorting protein
MMSQLRRTLSKSLFCLLLLLMLLVNLGAHAQTLSASLEPGPPGSDALPFLTELLARYTHASSYQLEYVEEHQSETEFSRNWSKTFITSIVGPSNHYRFEYRSEFGTAVQVSDGQTEWIYYGPLNQYVQQPASTAGPSEVMSRATIGLNRMRQIQSHMKNFVYLRRMIGNATFVPDQTIELAGKSMPCIVVTTEGKMPEARNQITIRFTFWIDKQTKLIRKSIQRSEGEVTGQTGVHYSGQDERLYQVAELDVSHFPEDTFTFAPRPSAILVKEFEDKQTQELAKLVGKRVAALTLGISEGKEVTLQSFAGKPVLLDFWATWCVPCRESLPSLEKLYQENRSKGLVLLSLDEDDDDAQKAAEFWTMRNEPWPNFHAGKDIREKFPQHGIPYFVLVDSSGKVTLSYVGLDENILRAAVAALTSSPTLQPPTTH